MTQACFQSAALPVHLCPNLPPACTKCHTDLQIKTQMVVSHVPCLHVGGARAAAGVWKRPGVTGEEPGALAGASARCGPDSRPGEMA